MVFLVLLSKNCQTSAQPAQAPVYQANITPTFYTPPLPGRMCVICHLTGNRPRHPGGCVLASTTWLKGAFATETEVIPIRVNSIPGDTKTIQQAA